MCPAFRDFAVWRFIVLGSVGQGEEYNNLIHCPGHFVINGFVYWGSAVIHQGTDC